MLLPGASAGSFHSAPARNSPALRWRRPMTSTKFEIVEPAASATTIEAPSADKAPDPFDLANLRLAQNYNETAGIKKLLGTVPVRKPYKQEFIRVHPDAAYRENFAMIELREEREEYLVSSGMVAELAAEIINKTLYTAVNRQG